MIDNQRLNILFQAFVASPNMPEEHMEQLSLEELSFIYAACEASKKNEKLKEINYPVRQQIIYWAAVDALKKAAIAQLKDGHPVWFGSDCMKFALRNEGIYDRASTNVEQMLGISYHFTKGERLMYGESAMDHAMAFMGVNLDENGLPDRWKIENSWGKDSGQNGGYYIASDSWFDEFVYQIAVNKAYLDPETAALLNSEEITELEPWDPMGTLALSR